MYSQTDAFVEHSVKKQVTAQMRALTALSIFFTVIFFLAGFLFNIVFMLLCVVYLVVTIYNILNTHGIEYEYEYTGGTLEIYKIIRKRKRKKLLVVDSGDIVVMAPAGTEAVLPYKGRKMRTYDVTSMRENVPFYVLIFRSGNSSEEQKVFFEATEEMAVAMRNANPRQVTVAPRNYELEGEEDKQ